MVFPYLLPLEKRKEGRKMKALNLYGPRDIRCEDVEKPKITSPKDVIIKVMVAGICGSDGHRYALLGPYVEGMTWGHEFSGVVEEIGSDVKNVSVGDRVSGCPTLYCGHCEFCKKGEFARCETLKVIGAKDPGCFAQYVKLPEENVVKIADTVSFANASMIEPSCVALHGLYKTQIEPGDDVAIMGCGTIGLLAVQWAKVFGAKRIIAIDIDESKLELAMKLGATDVINPLNGAPHEQLEKITGGRRADVAVESAGSKITSAQVFALARKGGKVVFLGIPYGDINIERFYFERIVRNELQIFGSWNSVSSPFPGKEWDTAAHFMSTGQVDPSGLITHRLDLDDGPEIFEKIAERTPGIGKVLFYPNGMDID